MKKTLFFTLLLVPCFAVAQQSASVNGYVTDTESGETLISANVALQGTSKGTYSNNSGYFTLTDIPPGTYTLQATYVGFRTYKKEIELEPGENLRLNIALASTGYELDEVVVESDADEKEQRDIGVAQVETELIKDLPSVFQADVFRSLQLLPGV